MRSALKVEKRATWPPKVGVLPVHDKSHGEEISWKALRRLIKMSTRKILVQVNNC
jgi:hypothetical protein